MSTTRKTVEQKIAESQAKIQQEQNALRKLQNQQKEQDRKVRNHRLCKRHGLIESLLPDIINLTDKQFEDFVRHHIGNSHGRNKLAEMVAEGVENTPAPKAEEQSQQSANPASQKSTEQTQQTANPATTKPTTAEQNQKPTAPAEAKNNNSNPHKNNTHNADRIGGNTQKHNASNVANASLTQQSQHSQPA